MDLEQKEEKKSNKKWKVIIPVIAVLLLTTLFFIVFALWSTREEELPVPAPTPAFTPAPTILPTPVPTPVPTPAPPKGKVKSTMTGKWIPKSTAQKRPYAVMIDNIGYAAMNQRGTANADILYEALAEGGITRMMAVYQDPDKVVKIGPVRSARHYYASFASEWNALFCHFGHTKYALSKIAQLNIDNISGLQGIGSLAYTRDYAYREPHNVFANGENMIRSAKGLKYTQKQNIKKTAKHFYFYNEDTDIEGKTPKKTKKALDLTVPFSEYSTVWLKYNKKKKVYEKYEYGVKHMDHASNKQLAFKNVLIQLVEERDIDRNGYQTMSIHKKRGNGYYITNGKMVAIEWTKDELKRRMCYKYDKNNKTVRINPGKTYIAVYPTSRKNLIRFNR